MKSWYIRLLAPLAAFTLCTAGLGANLWSNGNEYFRVQVCNVGNAAAAASTTDIQLHQYLNGGGGQKTYWSEPAPALAVGGCHNHDLQASSWSNACNNYHATADIGGVVAESNETDNSRSLTWCK